MMSIIKTFTNRGNECLFFNNFKFRKICECHNNDIRWRCTIKNCNCVIKTDYAVTKVIEISNVSHNHECLAEKVIQKCIDKEARKKKMTVESSTLQPNPVKIKVKIVKPPTNLNSSRRLRNTMIDDVNVTLLLCGSFNPITILHLRMLEIARDHLRDSDYIVRKGFISPVHDSYPKNTLISCKHRNAMVKLAVESSNWLQLSPWESEQQTSWTCTYDVLKYHQNNLNFLLNGKGLKDRNGNSNDGNGIVKLVCGADVLASFLVPNLWNDTHIERILADHGLIVITRSKYNISQIIHQNDILFKYRHRIIVVEEYIENSISSTNIRTACSRDQSIKYLVVDKVEQYINNNKLYQCNK